SLHCVLVLVSWSVLLPVSPVRLLFVSLRYLLRCDLHSFPTRRSSDLSFIISNTCSQFLKILLGKCLTYFLSALDSFFHTSRCFRSEEHTSELQSRFDLVCRLLLEKKKMDKKAASQCEVRRALTTPAIG